MEQVAPWIESPGGPARRQLELFFSGEARAPKCAIRARLLERHHGHGQERGLGSIQKNTGHRMWAAHSGALAASILSQRNLSSVEQEGRDPDRLVAALQCEILWFARWAP